LDTGHLVATVQAGIAAYNWNDMETLGALCAEDVEVYPFEGWPDDPVYCGREGMKRLASVWWENFEGTQIKAERLVEVGDKVVALMLQSGLQQGVKVEQRLGGVFEFRDGLWSRVEFFLGYEGALEATGLCP
jgi:DNA phosphorothioation-dependent restriction protein DptG